MSGPLRNKQGCWTCRVRKKKCDEARPICSTCESLSITCYGYGLKPGWVDHGEREKEMVDSFKQIVKHTSRKKPVTTKHSAVHLARIAPKTSNGASSSASTEPGSYNSHSVGPSPDRGSSADEGINTLQGEPLPEPYPKDDHHDHDVTIFSIPALESIALMHYLDVVFPLQYPMYRPNASEGGRGWLLASLLRLKPLYHATLAIGTYHNRKVLAADSGNYPCSVVGLVEQEKHLEICLAGFQNMLGSASKTIEDFICPNHGLSITALVVQLIFFEFFRGQGNEWKIHLKAATNMYQLEFRDHLQEKGLSKRTRAILQGDCLCSGDDKSAIMEEIMMYKFFTETIIWLDIISSVTEGKSPHLPLYHLHDITSISPLIKLEEVMGCENWAMVLIGRISALHGHKIQALNRDCLGDPCFDRTVGDISREIQSGLTHIALKGFGFPDGNNNSASVTDPTMVPNSHTLVTYMFALMASIYLHLVVYGFQRLELLETTTQTAMEMLHIRLPAHILPAIVCPLCVIGTVARKEEDRSFFRRIFSSPPLRNPLHEQRARILPALEEIWRRREYRNDLTWGDSLDLVSDLLLL